MKKLNFLIFVLALGAFAFPTSTYAQAAQASDASQEGDAVGFDAKGAFSKILVAGLVGGILGLSTLSFYEKPNQHLRNITFGAGAAMIGTAFYMTLSLASGSTDTAAVLEDFDQGYRVAPMVAANFGGISFSAQF